MDAQFLDNVVEPTFRFSFPEAEKEVLAFWQQIDAFQTSLALNADKPNFTFYDGPPFATGLPHYGHLLAGTIKDIVTRYAHQTGHNVVRRFGWDTHGLPVETEIDKKLNIKGAADVEKIGIGTYNEECRAIVMRYSQEWRQTVERMGRWIDFDNDYKTMNPSFMESVWWVFGQLWTKQQVYRGTKVMPYSTPLATPLSNFEANQNYKEAIDPAVTVAFKVKNETNVYLLAWTTTPWTLPSNLGLCVNPAFEYVKVKDVAKDVVYIFLEKRKDTVFDKKAKIEIVEKGISGASLVGLTYEPLFPYFAEEFGDRAFRVVGDAYVTDESGTGIVHQAPAFGEDDHRVAIANGIISKDEQPPCPIDANGHFTAKVADFAGTHVKAADDAICLHLKGRGLLVRKATINHSYPFCWRTDTPLIYRTIPSWFVRVENMTDKLLANNARSRWVPDFVQEKRFANWLGNARDWAISRNRYWGTPIPLWISDDGEEIVCVTSIAQLQELTGRQDITDIHRHFVDDLTIPSQQGKGTLKRIPEVFDCWFESGSMPYAQNHYPFESKETFLQKFPADFIAEGIDQTRGWFYTLLVLSTHLFDEPPAKNVIVNGLVLAKDGKKMSKRLKNYPEPGLVMNNHGADILRLYLINSPVVRAETLKFSEEAVRDLVKDVLIPWLNAFRFWHTQVKLFAKENNEAYVYRPRPKSTNIMDNWILARVASLIRFVQQEMAGYRLYTVVPRLLNMIEELTNWYIRFNRRRLKGDYGKEDCLDALNTLCDVLHILNLTMAPFTPFICESFYQVQRPYLFTGEGGHLDVNMKDTRSIHFLPFPSPNTAHDDPNIERAMKRMQDVIVTARAIRVQNLLPLKTGLKELIVLHPEESYHADLRPLETFIVEELNVRNITYATDEAAFGVQYTALPDWKALGAKHRQNIKKIKDGLGRLSSDDYKACMQKGDLTIEGITLQLEELQILRKIDKERVPQTAERTLASGSGPDVHVFLDITEDPELAQQSLLKEMATRLQKLRKRLKLSTLDDMLYFYKEKEGSSTFMGPLLASQQEYLLKVLRQGILPMSDMKSEMTVLGSDEIEVEDEHHKMVEIFVVRP